MYIRKVILIILLLLIIRILLINKDTFQSNEENTNLLVNTVDYNNVELENSKIKLEPNYNSNYNIDIGNDIIVEDQIKIFGKNINIDKLRYIKKLPIHYQDEICLSDSKGVECIKKEHIDVIKGNLPMNIITYPDNRRKCFSAVIKNITPEWTHGPWTYHIYTAENCQKGNINQEYFIKRASHTHGDESHYHIHGLDRISHEFHEEPSLSTLPVSNDFDIRSEISSQRLSRQQAISSGITEEQFDALDTDGDGEILASDLGEV